MTEYIDVQLRLQWPLIRKMACRAFVEKLTFDELVTMSMEYGIAQHELYHPRERKVKNGSRKRTRKV